MGDAGAPVVDGVVEGAGAAPPLDPVLVPAGVELGAGVGAVWVVVGVPDGWVLAGGWAAVVAAPAAG